MLIEQLKVHNFKSIDTVQINLNPLTMIVGANASGKSNLINVFRFIENIMTDGLDDAIALQGGIRYISNASLPKGEPIEISFTLDLKNEEWIRYLRNKKYALEVKDVNCHFIIIPNKRGQGYHIAYDYVKMTYDCYSYDLTANKDERLRNMNIKYCSVFERKNQNSSVKHSAEITTGEKNDELESCLKNDPASDFFAFSSSEDKRELMLFRLSLLLPPFFSDNTFIRIFDLDPKQLKRSSSMASTKTLEENGSNLASVLQTILRKRENNKKLTTLLQEFLPFVENLSIENNPDKSISYKIRENYYNKPFYANFLSDGTVSVLALIIALYFEDQSNIVILEEPERNIHPKLLGNLISSMEDVSQEKQIIITTHNPEFVKQTNIDDIRLVSRDSSGKTFVSKPVDNERVKVFIENDLGLNDLFLQDLLGE